MTNINPLPKLPDELPPRAVELPFELGPEHVEMFVRAVAHAAAAPDSEGPEWSTAQGLTEVVKLVWIEHVQLIEQALVASERDVAELGRRLHAALHDDRLPDADERARQRAGTDR